MINQGTLFKIDKIDEKKSNNEKSKKGTIMELECMVEYIKKGYWVAKSMDPQCPFDFVAVKDKDKDDIVLIDSKCASYRKDGTLINRVLKPYQKKLGVKLAVRNFKK
jgi:hypothetical protein